MSNFTDTIPHLNIEVLPGGLIRLENESMGDSYAVDVHPLQIRHIAEKAGLIESCDRDAEQTIAALLKAAARYKRALLDIKTRAEQLHDNIYNCSQRGHEDLGIEVAQCAALADFAEYVCIEFESEFTANGPGNNAAGHAELTALGAKAVKQHDTEPRQSAIPA